MICKCFIYFLLLCCHFVRSQNDIHTRHLISSKVQIVGKQTKKLGKSNDELITGFVDSLLRVDHNGKNCKKIPSNRTAANNIPVYWVNMKKSVKRAEFFAKQLSQLEYTKHTRIDATTPLDQNVSMEVIPRIEQTPTELSCVLSHLHAIYKAVHDSTIQTPYVIIAEDDIVFEMDVDFDKLGQAAPKKFGILQLMTSNAWYVHSNWETYIAAANNSRISHQNISPWTKWKWEAGYWSTQAYMINRKIVQPFIDKVVTLDSNGNPSFRVINPSPELFPCKPNTKCRMPFRIVAEYYLYLGCGPTYYFQVPTFNGARVNSSIHNHHKNTHAKSFNEISLTIGRAIKAADLLPSYVKPFTCA